MQSKTNNVMITNLAFTALHIKPQQTHLDQFC